METRSVTTAVLAGHLGNPPQYGSTAEEVLATCALVAAADEQWDEKQVSRFQKQVGIHEKVWGRLLSIHRSDRWKQVDLADLPGSYTTLYALATLEEEGWNELVARKLLTSTLTSRKILQWRLRDNIRADGFDRQIYFILATSSDKAVEEVSGVLSEFKSIAEKHNMIILLPTATAMGLTAVATPEEIVEKISSFLLPELNSLVQDAGKVVRDSLQIQTGEELLSAPLREFLKFVNRTAGSNAAALEAYGKEYCFKLALEYNKSSTTRANRFNYKKKLEEFSEGDPELPMTKLARKVIRDFVA